MAAVLNPFRGWLSAEGRAAREVKETEAKMADKPKVILPVQEDIESQKSSTSPSDQEDGNAQNQSDGHKDEQEQEPNDEYDESAGEDNKDERIALPRKSNKRKRQNQNSFQKNARLKASASETEESAESNESSSDEGMLWEGGSDSSEEAKQAVEDGSNCM